MNALFLSLAYCVVIGALIWSCRKIFHPLAEFPGLAWLVAAASLFSAGLFPVALGFSAWLVARDDGSETLWRASEKVVDLALLSPLLAIVLALAGVLAAKRKGNFELAPKLIAYSLCWTALCLGGLEILYTFAGGHPGTYHVANEARVVGSLRSLHAANLAYAAAHQQKFASSLSELCLNSNDKYLSSALSRGKAHGYRFIYKLGSTDAEPPKFEVVAEPLVPDFSGIRDFSIDQTGVVRYDSKYPTDKSPAL